MNRWLTVMDAQGDGIVRGAQPSTYDVAFYGANTFIGSLYMCALRAAVALAEVEGDSANAKKFQDRLTLAQQNYDKECFDADKGWYVQVVDPKHATNVVSDSTFVDSMLGHWWSQFLGLGDLMSVDHVKSTLQNCFKYNHVTAFDPARQAPRKFCDNRDAGMYIATWGGPENPPPSNALLYTSEAMWSGLGYPFAGLCLMNGLVSTGIQVLTDIRNQYDGTRRSPYNEIECGDHYTRQMSGFSLFEIASGQLWDATQNYLGFAPRVVFTGFSGFFITVGGWGKYSQQCDDTFSSGTATVETKYGTVTFHKFSIQSSGAPANTVISLNGGGALPKYTIEAVNGLLFVTFASEVKLTAGFCYGLGMDRIWSCDVIVDACECIILFFHQHCLSFPNNVLR
eukprot:m.67760 g.67760  ORF g.67760 m.67760 type:complete len:397 (+) comp11593_c1_seq1:2270-3460(+)